ncbi:MAG: hypothetical protein WC476_08920 [Phycisphaerae bacterium]|jgi:hypothetical protein
MYIKNGVTRKVFVFRKIAIKIPTRKSWRLFLQGLLANMQEKQWSGVHPFLMPVLFALPGGFVIVMPACERVFEQKEPKLTWALRKLKNDDYYEFFRSDYKPGNFGIYKGQVVKIDYGN